VEFIVDLLRIGSHAFANSFVRASLVWYPVFLAIWWAFAIRYYLRMPHAAVLGIALSTMAFLFTWLVAAIICIAFYS
jgi:hypothetical protein